MQPADIARLITVSDPKLSPDGHTVAYVQTRADMDAGCYRSAIWLAPANGATPPRQFSAGTEADSQPAWSPDGSRLVFTRSTAAPGSDNPPSHELLMAPVEGPGETVTLARHKHEAFAEPTWSPDGRHIAYMQRVRDKRYEPEEEQLRPPRHITRVWNRLDSVGWTIDRPRHLFVLPVDGTAAPRQLTSGTFDHASPSWSPDSSKIVVAAARHDRWDIDPATDLWLVDATAVPAGEPPEPKCLTETVRAWAIPRWSPDGSRIAALVQDEHKGYRHSQVGVIDLATGAAEVLTEALDRNCAPMGAQRLVWTGDDALLFAADDAGHVPVMRVLADGSNHPEVVIGSRFVTGFDASSDGSTIVFCATSATRPPELFTANVGHQQKLTSAQDAFLAACPAHPAERFGVGSPAGDGEIDAWMMRPPGFQPEGSYPMLLQIHGGPMAQHGDTWFDEAQLYASAGYVVVYSNPHGSTGGPETWTRAIQSPLAAEDPGTGWGGIDYEDLMAVVDVALEREPAIDSDRLGVLGGSYGGYMTSWIVSHNDRFVAACSERACNSLLTLEMTSDFAGAFHWLIGADSLEHPDELLRMSPISYVKDIHTPLLIIHSENDLRCDIEQADQLFVQLRLLEREVEYWRFADESHELSRSGSPVHRKQRAEIILDWFDRYLKP